MRATWALILGRLCGVQGDPWLSSSCLEARLRHGLNFTKLQVLAWKHYRLGKGQDFVVDLDEELVRLSKGIYDVRAALLDACAAASAVAAGILMQFELRLTGTYGTNIEHERHFRRLSTYQREVTQSFKFVQDRRDELFWPLLETLNSIYAVTEWLTEKVESSRPHWDPPEENVITDESYLQALQDVKDIMDEAGVDWFPYEGTLIALLRHGFRSGELSNGKQDVVDHDVDVLVGVISESHWLQLRWFINNKLRDKGWDACFSRTSVDAPHSSMEYALAREDLMLCTRQDPPATLDLGSYIIGERKIFVQRSCVAGSCWLPHVGTFRLGKGFLRKESVYPLGHCKAGDFSVPCPRNPLDVLRVTLVSANFSEHCMALPDVVQRKTRGYTDDDTWTKEDLQPEDVEVLRRRASELEQQGYMSMAPYFSLCNLSS